MSYDYLDQEIYKEDMEMLRRGGWLTDSTVSACFRYVECIVHRDNDVDDMIFMNAAVTSYAIRENDEEDFAEIFEDFDIDKKRMIFFPINDSNGLSARSGSHWSMLIFDRDAKDPFMHFDSAKSASRNLLNAKILFKKVLPLLKLDLKAKDVAIKEMKCPQQTNAQDCGLYACKFAECYSSGDVAMSACTPSSTRELRAVMVKEIETKAKAL